MRWRRRLLKRQNNSIQARIWRHRNKVLIVHGIEYKVSDMMKHDRGFEREWMSKLGT